MAELTKDRAYWLWMLDRTTLPLLDSFAEGTLKAKMPIEAADPVGRGPFAYLEAVARTVSGLSPWISLSAEVLDAEEAALQSRVFEQLRVGFSHCLNAEADNGLTFSPGSPEQTGRSQPLVDSAFLAQGFIRCPRLWVSLGASVQEHLVRSMKQTRAIHLPDNNWLLFAAMLEAFYHRVGAEWDPVRAQYAIRQFEQWYLGDGIYGDGPELHFDYYNSYVIQPMLLDVLDELVGEFNGLQEVLDKVRERATRYAGVQERLIAPDGTFPAVGRSLAYRFGAFSHLSTMALRQALPDRSSAPGVRTALTAVLRRTLDVPGTFDAHGWLQIGLSGHQPSLGERYITTGSLYLALGGFAALGLPPQSPFWADKVERSRSERIWEGEDVLPDHAL